MSVEKNFSVSQYDTTHLQGKPEIGLKHEPSKFL